MATWITDANGNKCSVEYFGSREEAQKALNSLTNCSDCSNCSNLKNSAPKESDEILAVPVVPNIHNTVYVAVSGPNALNMSEWHTCETTHCRAGWVITLAGEDGKKLESRFGPVLAAMMIYDASAPGYKINPCRFFDSNEAAIEDMKHLAESAQ